jgi:hypothetical protein
MKFIDGIQQYVSRKHAEGIEFHRGEEYLRGLGQCVGDVRLDQVKTQHILSFLDRAPTAAVTWRLKYFVLQHFFDFWSAREAMPEYSCPP